MISVEIILTRTPRVRKRILKEIMKKLIKYSFKAAILGKWKRYKIFSRDISAIARKQYSEEKYIPRVT